MANYSQRDPQWAGQRLGTCDGVTIGSDGCYIAAYANIASHFGKDVTPASLDDICTNRFYVNGCLCTDDLLQKVYPDIVYQGTFHFEDRPADFSVLVNTFQDEYVIEIDANPAVPGVQTHFMRFYDYFNGVLRVIDSWTGQLISVSDVYGDAATAVQKIVHYVGPAPAPTTPPPAVPVVDPAPVVPEPHVAEPVVVPDPPQPIPIVITPTGDTPMPEVIPPAPTPATTEPAVKTGVKTTEFWMNLLVQVTAIVTVATTAANTPGSTIVKALAVIGAVLATLGYTNGRSKVKAAALAGPTDGQTK